MRDSRSKRSRSSCGRARRPFIALKGPSPFDGVLQRVTEDNERILLVRGGKPVAALIPVEDLETLERIEDRIDLEEARGRLADPDDNELPYEEVRRALGLD